MIQLGAIANYWYKGYRENFTSEYPIEPILRAIKELPGGKCLEIGCGDGYWTTELLVPKFKEVIAVDVIEEPKYFKGEYHKQTECSLKQFSDASLDAVYSVGVFCHLPLKNQMEYLKEVRRVLKGKGLIVFANWHRHGSLRHKEGFVDGWYYNDTDTTKQMLTEAGFQFIDFDTNYRDTIAIIW